MPKTRCMECNTGYYTADTTGEPGTCQECNAQVISMDEYYKIPERTLNSIYGYVKKKYAPGGFLTAVLSNDLFDATARADADNLEALPQIVKFIYNNIPSDSWGSKKLVEEWLK